MDPSLLISSAALLGTLAMVWVQWRSHRHTVRAVALTARATVVTELREEVNSLRRRLEASETRVEDQDAVIEGQRKEIAKLTIAERDCAADNLRMSGRIFQLEGEVRQMQQLDQSRKRIEGP